jgi:succinate dehydrogenase/fumarate reductase flavoprotein subunit
VIDRVDVVVAGSGLAGLSAATAASRRGASVLVAEKADRPGGSSALSAGMFWTAPDLEAYVRRIPGGDLRLARRLIDDFEPALDEIRQSGVTVADEPKLGVMTYGIGYSFDVRGYLALLREDLLLAGGTIVQGTAVVAIERTADGLRVKLDDSDGRHEVLAAAVVLATGGFQGSAELLSELSGAGTERLVHRSNPDSTGDGLRLAEASGAAKAGDFRSFYGHLLPAPMTDFGPEQFLPYSQYYSERTVLLNARGERFIDETLGDEILNQALLDQPDARGILVFDDEVRRVHATAEPFPGLGVLDRYAAGAAAGARTAEAPSLGALVEAMTEIFGTPADTVRATLEGYARAVSSHEDVANGVAVGPGAEPPRRAPFYAIEVQPSITFTFGGIAVDDRGRALDAEGVPVPGLFAAGADIGGLSRVGYAGGLAPAFITGRWAGESAALALQTR